MGHGSIKMTYDVYGHWLGDPAAELERLADDVYESAGRPRTTHWHYVS
jgi:hypothetical protein